MLWLALVVSFVFAFVTHHTCHRVCESVGLRKTKLILATNLCRVLFCVLYFVSCIPLVERFSSGFPLVQRICSVTAPDLKVNVLQSLIIAT